MSQASFGEQMMEGKDATIGRVLESAKSSAEQTREIAGAIGIVSKVVFGVLLFLAQVPALMLAPFLRVRMGILSSVFGVFAATILMAAYTDLLIAEPGLLLATWLTLMPLVWLFHSGIAIWRLFRPKGAHVHRWGAGEPVRKLGRVYDVLLGWLVKHAGWRQTCGEIIIAFLFGLGVMYYVESGGHGFALMILGWLPAGGLTAHAFISFAKSCWARQMLLDSQLEQEELAAMVDAQHAIPDRQSEGVVAAPWPSGRGW